MALDRNKSLMIEDDNIGVVPALFEVFSHDVWSIKLDPSEDESKQPFMPVLYKESAIQFLFMLLESPNLEPFNPYLKPKKSPDACISQRMFASTEIYNPYKKEFVDIIEQRKCLANSR